MFFMLSNIHKNRFLLLKSCLALVFAGLLCSKIGAQNGVSPEQDTTGKLKVESSLTGEGFIKDGRELRKLSGNVRLRQENTLIFCDTAIIDQDDAVLKGNVVIEQTDTAKIFADSALYYGNIRQADLFGKVVLINGEQQLFTKKMRYDLAKKIATYHNGARLNQGKSQLVSKHGYYYVAEKEVYFKGDVVGTNPDFTLRTDTMTFNTEAQLARFVAPTIISQRDGKVYCEGGFYDIAQKFAEFDVNPQYERKGQRGRSERMKYNGVTKAYILQGNAYIEEPAAKREVRSDMIWYNTETEQALLTGNATYKDSAQDISGERIFYDKTNQRYQLRGRGRVSDPPNIIEGDSLDFNQILGNGVAQGNVIWRDTSNNMTLEAYRIDYNKNTKYVHAWGGFGEKGPRGRPLLKSLVDRDTLFLASDTLVSYLPDTSKTDRLLLAYRDVRIFKKDLQAVADSVSFDTADSTFRFYQIKNTPLLWSDTSQFSGDTIWLSLRNQKPDRLWLRQNSLIVNSSDGQFFNQIKGRNCTTRFEDAKAREMFVEGNAEAVYYALDDQEAYIGVNETQCAEMRLFFNNNQVESIRFYTEPKGKFIPIKEVGNSGKKLKGFFWEKSRRPRRLADLF